MMFGLSLRWDPLPTALLLRSSLVRDIRRHRIYAKERQRANRTFSIQFLAEAHRAQTQHGVPAAAVGAPLCIMHTGWEGPDWTINAAGQRMGNLAGARLPIRCPAALIVQSGQRMGNLAGALAMIVGRPVIDKTGITGRPTIMASAPARLPIR